MKDQGFSYKVLDLMSGKIDDSHLFFSEPAYQTPEIAAGETGIICAWYLPKKEYTKMPATAVMMKFVDANKKGQRLWSKNELPPRDALQVGKAYHIYTEYDGKNLNILDNNGTALKAAGMTFKTDLAQGKRFKIKVRAGYNEIRDAFIDLNGNGVKDSGEELSSYSDKTCTVNVQEITIYGKIASLTAQDAGISKFICNNVALVELDLRNNNLSKDALDEMMNSLPDVNNVEKSFSNRHLQIDGNPGADEANLKIGYDKGWILDLPIVDYTKPFIRLYGMSYGNKKLYLRVVCKTKEDEATAWVDLNGNGKKDEGEAITKFGMDDENENEFIYDNKNINVYGNIEKLDCSNSSLFAIVTGTNTDLKYLRASQTGLIGMIVAGKSEEAGKAYQLEYLDLSWNQLYTDELDLDISDLPNLKSLNLEGCLAEHVDLSKNTKLETLNVSTNELTQLRIGNQKNLKTLMADNNQLKYVDIANNQALRHISITTNAFTDEALNLFFSKLPDLKSQPAPGSLFIANNPGLSGADLKVPKTKNWDVDTRNKKSGNTGKRPNMPGEEW